MLWKVIFSALGRLKHMAEDDYFQNKCTRYADKGHTYLFLNNGPHNNWLAKS